MALLALLPSLYLSGFILTKTCNDFVWGIRVYDC